jgi:short-subunit dehydrogenase
MNSFLQGAKLILASRSTDKLEKLCQELADQEPQSNQKYAPLFKPKYCRLDLEEIAKGKEELENFMATNLRPLLFSSNQQIDVLINNAGQMAYGRAMDTEMAVLRRILDVNFVAHSALTQAIWPNIPDNGAIVVLGSIVSRKREKWN